MHQCTYHQSQPMKRAYTPPPVGFRCCRNDIRNADSWFTSNSNIARWRSFLTAVTRRGRWKRGSGQCGSGNTGQTLPTTSAEADTAVRNSRYAVLDDSEFYRGLAGAGGDGSALVFASNAQLELLQSCDADILRRRLQSAADHLLPIIHCIRSFRESEGVGVSPFILGTTLSTPAISVAPTRHRRRFLFLRCRMGFRRLRLRIVRQRCGTSIFC